MAIDIVTFGAVTILAAGNGGCEFTMASPSIDLKPVRVVRSSGGWLAKNLGSNEPPIHTLTLSIIADAITTVKSAIEAIYDGVAHDLTVKGYPPITCYATGKPQWAPKQKYVNFNTGAEVDLIQVTLTFLEL